MAMRCIAIDDEPLALRQISGYISKIPFLELAATFRSAVAAQEWLQKNEIDLIFVDINMPDMTGVEFVQSLDVPAMVIFTTAYAEYAIEGFKLSAIGNIFTATFFNRIDSFNRRTASSQHRVYNINGTFFDCRRQFAEIFMRFQGFFITIHTDMTNFCCRHQFQHTANHAQTCS